MVQKKVVRYFGKKVDKKISRPETYIRKKSGYFRQFFFIVIRHLKVVV